MNENLNPAWSRITTVMEYAGKIAGYTFSVNAFAHHVGMIRAESLYRVKKGTSGVGLPLALKISAAYPLFNVLWLIGAAPEPYRYDPTVPLVGKWKYIRVDMLDLSTGRWKDATAIYTPEIWDIPENGRITITVEGEVVDQPEYSFNPTNGRFNVSHDTFHIVRLTDTEMEYADWTESIVKFIYERIA